jgi:hypothetical protein
MPEAYQMVCFGCISPKKAEIFSALVTQKQLAENFGSRETVHITQFRLKMPEKFRPDFSREIEEMMDSTGKLENWRPTWSRF